MRENLFHGKRKDNGDWVEGCLLGSDVIVPKGQQFYICHDILDSALKAYEVIPETVGQYTGLTDKNGRKIFEGDIVKIPLYEGCQEKAIAVVAWDILCAVFYLHGKRVNTDFYHYFGNDCEVIGNIYDNPESEVTND